MIIKGKVHKLGDDINTDDIIAAKYLVSTDVWELGKHCLESIKPDFVGKVTTGDIIVAGKNFGCGSSREHAPLAIKEAGIGVVIARSFARIFYRNAFNIGLPLLESDEAAEIFSDGDRVLVDLGSGEIRGEDNGNRVQAKSIPEFMMEIVKAGGLVTYIKKKGDF